MPRLIPFSKHQKKFAQLPGQLYLWIAVILFAVSNSFVRKLTDIGSQHLVDGRNPISPCNVLFVSNLCALLILVPLYYRQLNFRLLKQLDRQDWSILILVAILAGALAPGFIFQALSITNVTNVIVVGRIEPPLILALSVWLLRERIGRWEIAGALVSLAGVLLTVFLQPIGKTASNAILTLSWGQGETLTLIGISAAAIATVISKAQLAKIPLGLFIIIRTGIGTIVFFFLATYLYGLHHFADAFSPFLWKWMLFYGTIIVAFGQFCWSIGLKKSTTSEVSLVNSFSPVAGILTAYLILNETITLGQILGCVVILGGLLLSQIGIWQKTASTDRITNLSTAREMEAGLGLKGV